MPPRALKISRPIWVTGSVPRCEPRRVLFMSTWPMGSVIRAFVYTFHWGSHFEQGLFLFLVAYRAHLAGPHCCPVVSLVMWFFVLGGGHARGHPLGFAYRGLYPTGHHRGGARQFLGRGTCSAFRFASAR